ncbi:MAG: CinA family protein [Oscillospiraceae bacterium]|nr:CinA family protein [Oscillospiraceae bacterium]
MMNLCSDLLKALDGRTFATAESCTGGGIGAAFTAIAGSSKVYKGGIISYTNWVKEHVLGVDAHILKEHGAVSEETAMAMAIGVRRLLQTDFAVSVTGIAGPESDEFNTPVGTVYIGLSSTSRCFVKKFIFDGDRNTIRRLSVEASIKMLLGCVEGEKI